MQILIADDSKSFRTIYDSLLRNWGFDVISTSDGQEAWDIYKVGKAPPLAIVDWEMPGMNGIEFCQQIRQLPTLHQPYIIMVTNKDLGEEKALALTIGADDFISKPFKTEELRARLYVGQRTISLQHSLVDSLATLEHTVKEHERVLEKLGGALTENEGLLASFSSILIEVDKNGLIVRWNQTTEKTFGIHAHSVIGRSFGDCGLIWDWRKIMQATLACEQQRTPIALEEIRYEKPGGGEGVLRITINPLLKELEKCMGFLLVGDDMTHRKQLEAQLALAQKMESIGQLAAGIAHEINTPTQFVNDNLRFLQDSFSEIQTVLQTYGQVFQAVQQNETMDSQLIQAVETSLNNADLEYMILEIPKALQQSLDGAERIAKIVRAMKTFSYPSTAEKKPIDLNKAIESTATVARNEWKYVAELSLDLSPSLPLVPCLPGEFNQVILNLIINAAHAISNALELNPVHKDQKGEIMITTQVGGEWAEIRVADTGTGIPEAAREKIFDPFFTTKEVGKGTGQGLAIAHDVIVKKHGGTLTCESVAGTGTTFIIRLPLYPTVSTRRQHETKNLIC